MSELLSVPGPALLFKGRQVVQIYLRIAEAQSDRSIDFQTYSVLNEDLKSCVGKIIGANLSECRSDLLHVTSSKKKCVMGNFFDLCDDEGPFTFNEEKFRISIQVLATKETLERLHVPLLDEDCLVSALIPIDEPMDIANISIESDQIGNESLVDLSNDLNAKSSDEYMAILEREE